MLIPVHDCILVCRKVNCTATSLSHSREFMSMADSNVCVSCAFQFSIPRLHLNNMHCVSSFQFSVSRVHLSEFSVGLLPCCSISTPTRVPTAATAAATQT